MKIEFTTCNEDFDKDRRKETMCIIQKIKNEIFIGLRQGDIFDDNGNKIGKWNYDENVII